eukprot:jgi/Ulvmu1/2077/UM123_0009.1
MSLLSTAVEANFRNYRDYQYNPDYVNDYQSPDHSGFVAPPLVDCAIQFFAAGMHGKGVRVQTTRDDRYAVDQRHNTKTASAMLDSGKAVVSFEGAVDEHDPKKVDVHLHVEFTANYAGCTFEDLTFHRIIDNGGSSGGSGNCYTIEQTCGDPKVTSVYGTVLHGDERNSPAARATEGK